MAAGLQHAPATQLARLPNAGSRNDADAYLGLPFTPARRVIRAKMAAGTKTGGRRVYTEALRASLHPGPE